MLQTPIIQIKKGKKLQRWFYSLNDEIKLKVGETSKYLKGLGSWKTVDLKHIVEKDGIDKMINILEFDDEDIIDDWLSDKKADKRKEYIIKNDFSINKI